jgi:hypothetical protein
MPVAVYPLTGTSLEAVQTWASGDLRHALDNGARPAANAVRATKVEVATEGSGPVVAAHFAAQGDVAKGDPLLGQFWQEYGVGTLGTRRAVVPDEQWGVRPDAVMVW